MTEESPSSRGTDPRASERGLVLMADRSEEADSIADALRGVGLSVLTCDVVALPERATRVDPVAILVDLEQANSRVAVERLQEQRLAGELDCLLIVLGTKALVAEMGLRDHEDVDVLERPVNGSELARLLRDRLGHVSLSGLGAPPSSVGSSPLDSSPLGSSPLASESDDALLSDFPAIASLPEVAGILPELGGGRAAPTAGELSPEIESLLTASARRVAESDPDVGPSAQVPDVPVPPEMMAMVDDLLAPDGPPETRGGMSLSARIDRDEASRPMEASAPGPGSEPSFDSYHSVATAAASSSHGSEPPKTGLDTSIAEEQTRVPHPGEPPPTRGAYAGPAALGRADSDVPTGVPDTAPPDAPEGFVDASVSPGYPRAPERHGAEGLARQAPGPGRKPPAPPAFAEAARSPSAFPSAASTLRGPEALGFGRGRPAKDPPRFGAAGPESDLPPESGGLGGAIPAEADRRGQGTDTRDPRDTSAPRTAYMPLEELEPPSNRSLPDEGDPIELLATAVRSRATGALVLSDVRMDRLRRILMRDGDISNAASEHPGDALVAFLVERGDLDPQVADMQSMRLPHTGRHAAAALIAHGFLGQDDLWPVLRAHAEWILSRALGERPARCQLEAEPPERLRAEPNVFGGAAGVEVLVEAVRRVLSPAEAYARLGGAEGLVDEGINGALLAESALSPEEMDVVRGAPGTSVAQLITQRGEDFAPVLYALAALGIVHARRRSAEPAPSEAPAGLDPLDVDAVRKRVAARLALVHDGSYFALLGLPLNATGYDIRRAYLELRRTFEPNRLITAATVDLREDAELIVAVLDEAYDILRDPHRRARYRRAIEATRTG